MKKEDLAKELKEIVELAKMCPQNLQEKCFEILLTHALAPATEKKHKTQTAEKEIINLPDEETPDLLPEIKKRVKTFAGQHQITDVDIHKIFSFDDTGNSNIEVADLKAKKTAQQQRNLALLIGVRHQFTEGNFNVPLDELREECINYSTYDAANFSKNLKNMKEIFAGFKASATNKLSPKGKKQAAELIKELAT